MAEESVMGQEMKSWLKQECVEVGTRIFDIYHGFDDIYDAIFDMSREWTEEEARPPEWTIDRVKDAAKRIIERINYATAPLTSVEAAQLRQMVDHIVSQIPPEKWPLSIEVVNDLTKLQTAIQHTIFEKVVECQIGKPPISPGRWEITIPTDIEALYAKGVITDDERSYLLLELHKGPFTIQEGKITRAGSSSSNWGEHFTPLRNFWKIVNTVEENLTDDEYKAMGVETIAGAAYGLADEFPEVVGIIKVNTQGARDNVMRIIHTKIQLVPTGLEIKWWNIEDKAWFIIFQEAGR